MNLLHRCSNITAKQMDMERAAINWGLTMSQAKVKHHCKAYYVLCLASLVVILHFVSNKYRLSLLQLKATDNVYVI